MALKTLIKDGRGTNNLAGVSTAGELVVRGFGNNQSNNQSMSPGQVSNFFPPLAGQTFVITTIISSLSNNATLTIFSAPSAASATIDIELLTITVLNDTTIVIPLPFGGFLSTGEGEFLNAIASIATNTTIIGFYKPVQ